MALKLANNEQIVKSWSVAASATSKNLKNASAIEETLNVTITNKRLVMQNETASSVKRNEILLKDVSGVSVYRDETTSVKGYNFFVTLGVLLLLAGLAFIIVKSLPTFLGIIFMVFGVIMFFIRIKKINVAFALTVHTRAVSSNIIDFSIGFMQPVNNGKNNKTETLYYFVNKEEVFEIADVIGSLLVDKN